MVLFLMWHLKFFVDLTPLSLQMSGLAESFLLPCWLEVITIEPIGKLNFKDYILFRYKINFATYKLIFDPLSFYSLFYLTFFHPLGCCSDLNFWCNFQVIDFLIIFFTIFFVGFFLSVQWIDCSVYVTKCSHQLIFSLCGIIKFHSVTTIDWTFVYIISLS